MSKNFKDLVLAGYQGWFATPANKKIGRWSHWTKRDEPQPGGFTSFELYPDLSEYKDKVKHKTGYADLHGGGKSFLYDSELEGVVVDLHFQWMKEYELDGIALQRFLNELQGKTLDWRNSTALHVKKAAKDTGKSFYIMYDITGYRGRDLEEDILDDVEEFLKKKLKLLDSPGYARQDGKPVIAIWGLGFPHIHKNLQVSNEEAKRLIKKLQDSHGCYVAGGVPYHWRTGEKTSIPGWLDVYTSFDMLIPWSVGGIPNIDKVNEHFESIWKPDKAFCDEKKIDLQRVIYPGFSWFNKKEAIGEQGEISVSRHLSGTKEAKKNQIRREGGKFFWRQAFHVASLKLGTGAFIAMFDEFDEGTVIAKAAKNQAGIPSNQWFLTLDADGTSLSSDFYLRLAAEGAKMIKGMRDITEEVPVSHLNYMIYVKHGYLGILGREADPDGLEANVKFLETEGTLLQFCQGLANSGEFKNDRQHLIADEADRLAEELYLGILNRRKRDVDSAGLESTIRAIKEGQIAQRAADMLNSQEFFDRFM
jgi:hypothetical protein